MIVREEAEPARYLLGSSAQVAGLAWR